ncbi:hypothetical protein QN092_21315 (plasmid) [Proteus vulgaris]|uniref:hypothetical protein n=1 Tax=Proteus vulgaris TaxID=585 RepID=UPI00253FC735|nr:hypothetical protein [Proteus vulgaris]WIF74502.1 hypothetical protein QN092_21315 [Proteus vulgaris]
MKSFLKVQKLQEERIDNCPSCGHPVFKTMPVGWSKSLKQGYIFSDGDTVGGVWQRLTEKQKKPNAFAYFLNSGHCMSCNESYFSIEFNFINYHEKCIKEIFNTDVGQYLLMNKDVSEPKNYVISQSVFNDIPNNWIMSVIETPYGKMYQHEIGLMSMSLFDECECKDADMVLKLFDDLKKVIATD